MTAIPALMLTIGLALADTFISPAGLESHLRALNRSVAEPILVGAAGPEAEKILDKLQRSGPPLPIRVVRVPTLGDVAAEMHGALASAGLRCGLRVGTTDGANLVVETYGDCRSAAEVAASPEPPAPPAAAPVSPPTPPTRPSAPVVVADIPSDTGGAPSSGSGTALGRGDLLYVARAWAKAPDPTVALLESAIVGFGAGHFYADHPKQGAVHLGLQVGGLAVVGLGTLASANARTASAARVGSFFTVLGSVTFTADRFADIYTAPLSAREARVRTLGGH